MITRVFSSLCILYVHVSLDGVRLVLEQLLFCSWLWARRAQYADRSFNHWKVAPVAFWTLKCLARTSSSAEPAPESQCFDPEHTHSTEWITLLNRFLFSQFCYIDTFFIITCLDFLLFLSSFQPFNCCDHILIGCLHHKPAFKLLLCLSQVPDTKHTSSHRQLLRVY